MIELPESNQKIKKEIIKATEILRKSGIVAFPTETYYGLAVDPFNSDALDRLYKVKKRESAKPLLVLIDDKSKLSLLVKEIPPVFLPLMDNFWPGPLTLIFNGNDELPMQLTGNTGTVGIRISSHPIALRLTKSFGGPITATSANISGKKAAESVGDIQRQFGSSIETVLDGGRTPGVAASTIVGLKNNELALIRPGVISYERIKKCFKHSL